MKQENVSTEQPQPPLDRLPTAPDPDSRLLFAFGARGEIIRSIQQALAAARCHTGMIDGKYGTGTRRAVSLFQKQARLPLTGNVDSATWSGLMKQPVSSIFERALQLTAAFEGHGFGTIKGNWDGAWLTWGIIGFTFRYGGIQKILLNVKKNHPALLYNAFGEETPKLLKMLRSLSAAQETWANTISAGARVKEPWGSGFQRLGNQPAVQNLQRDLVRADYFDHALKTAAHFGLTTERGIALAFDIHVQNGGIKKDARATILREFYSGEPALRIAIANAVANAANPNFREDVRARKLTLATGRGTVHGETITTDDWGVGEYAVQLNPEVSGLSL